MKARRTCKIHDGFTLIELLVVIAIIALLVAITAPSIHTVMRKGRMMSALVSGKGIYQAILGHRMDNPLTLPGKDSGLTYANSTDYWKWVVTNQIVDSTFAIFSVFGVPPYEGLEATSFTEQNNAWCMVSDIRPSDRAMMPVMFTRNLTITKLSEDPEPAVSEGEPFGRYGVIIINKDTSGFIRKPQELTLAFNPAKATNDVLRP